MQNKIDIDELQQLVLRAQAIHERDWTENSSSWQAKRDAANEACETHPEWAHLVYLLLITCWYDAQDLKESR